MFEYALPLNAVMPKELAVPPDRPIIRRARFPHELNAASAARAVARGKADCADDPNEKVRVVHLMMQWFCNDTVAVETQSFCILFCVINQYIQIDHDTYFLSHREPSHFLFTRWAMTKRTRTRRRKVM